MLLSQNAKRLSIFAYFDKDGIVDGYVIYMLKAVRKFCARQVVIVNGTLTPQSEATVQKVCDKIIYRDNSGFDVTAYKEAFLSEDVSGFDEILFYNQTIFGPVYPLCEMFDKMAARDIDFWGLTRHKGARAASWDDSVAINPHVQSFFFAVRSSMFNSAEFAKYWQNLPKIETYWDAVGKHEVVFTKHFADLGFKWDVYISTEALEKYNDYPLMGMPQMLLEAQHCPFFKRKSFVCARHSYTTFPQGEAPQRLYDYVRTKTDYPVQLINENITRTVSLPEICEAFTLYLPVQASEKQSGKAAAVIWCKTAEMLDTLANAAKLQNDAAIFCLVPNDEIKQKAAAVFAPESIIVTNNIHGMRYMFKEMWGVISKYKYVLYLTNDIPPLLDEFYDATTLINAAESLAAQNASAMLEDREDIGVLLPVNIIHQECCTLQNEWKYVCAQLEEKLKSAGINVPLNAKISGVASRGGMFLARTSALAPLSKYAFDDSDFDKLYSPCEYLAPLAAQSAGLLTAYSCSAQTAYAQLANTDAVLQDMFAKVATPTKNRYDKIAFRLQAILDFYYERRYQMTLTQAFNAKFSFKQKLWIILQIIFKPETFAKIQKALGHKETEAAPPHDDLD